MRKKLLLLLTWALLVPAGLHAAAEVERYDRGLQRVTPTGSTYYNPTGIRIGNYLYMYMQGSDLTVEPVPPIHCDNDYYGDTIIAYRAPIDPATGDVGALVRLGRISPSVYSPTNGNPTLWNSLNCPNGNPPASYGPGQVFESTLNGVISYHLVADASDVFLFRNVWRAISSDGINWTWYVSGDANPASGGAETLTRTDGGGSYTITWVKSAPLLKSDHATLRLTNPIFLGEVKKTGSGVWTGFMNYFHDNQVGEKVAALKIEWSTSGPPTPTVKVVTSTSPSWQYTTLANGTFTNGGPSPAVLLNNHSIKTYTQTDRGLEAWGWTPELGTYGQNVSCAAGWTTESLLTCTSPVGCATGDNIHLNQDQTKRPFWMNTGPAGDSACTAGQWGCWGSGFLVWPVGSGGVLNPAAGQAVYSEVRPLPAGYMHGRMYPFRIDISGTNRDSLRRYLFSVTNDQQVCSEFLYSVYYLMYLVKTEVRYTL